MAEFLPQNGVASSAPLTESSLGVGELAGGMDEAGGKLAISYGRPQGRAWLLVLLS